MRCFALSILLCYVLQGALVELLLVAMPSEAVVDICCATRTEGTPCCCLPVDDNGEQVACDLEGIVGLVMRSAPCDTLIPTAYSGPAQRVIIYHLVPTSVRLPPPLSFASPASLRFVVAYSLSLDLPDKVPIV